MPFILITGKLGFQVFLKIPFPVGVEELSTGQKIISLFVLPYTSLHISGEVRKFYAQAELVESQKSVDFALGATFYWRMEKSCFL